MKAFHFFATAALLASLAPASAAYADDAAPAKASVKAGQMLYDSASHRVASVYRVTADGSAQVILDGKLVTAPAATLSVANGKLMTSLSKSDLVHAR